MRSFQTQCNEAWSKTGFFQVPSPCSEKNPVLNPLTLFILRNHSPSFGSKHFVLVEHFISPQISIFVITSSGLISQLVWDSPSFQICHQGALNHSNYWGKVGFEFVTVFSVKSKKKKKRWLWIHWQHKQYCECQWRRWTYFKNCFQNFIISNLKAVFKIIFLQK